MRKTLLVLSLLLGPALFAQTADLRITAFNFSTDALAQTGQRFQLELRWRNDGPAPARFMLVTVTGTPVPFYVLSVATSGWPCYPSPDGTSFSCQNEQLDAGADAVLLLQMLAPPTAGPFTVRAEVRSAEADPQPSNNVAERTFELAATQSVDLAVTPSTQTFVTTAGAPVAMPVNVTNNGDARIDTVIAYVSIPLTDNLAAFDVQGAGWTCGHLAYGPQAVICTRRDLEPGQNAPLTITTNAPPANGSLTVTTRVRGEGHSDPFLGNDIATATVRVGEDAPPPAPEWSRILISLIGADLPGTNHALWRSEVTALVANDTPIEIKPVGCEPCVIPPTGPPVRRPFNVYEEGVAGFLPNGIGQFLYVHTADEAKLHLNSRVYDVSRTAETAGSEIPIVRGNDFTSTTVSLLGIPVAPQYRHTLRVYDLDAHQDGQVLIRIYANAETAPRATFVRNLSVPQGARTTVAGLPTHPGVIQVELGQLMPLAGISALRVDIEPVTPGLRLWSFVSVTNNETHHVTTFSQH
jgi:hypothetical protein